MKFSFEVETAHVQEPQEQPSGMIKERFPEAPGEQKAVFHIS